MALGDFTLFQWKSKETREKEAKAYAEWAFPHGQRQRDKLEALMKELKPKESVQFLMMGYLTTKELYERYLEKMELSEKALDFMINDEKKYKQIVRKHEMTTYLALVIADAEIGEECEYPPADEIRLRIEDLEKLRRRRGR